MNEPYLQREHSFNQLLLQTSYMSGLMLLVHTHNSPGRVWSGVAQHPDAVKMKGCGVSVLGIQRGVVGLACVPGKEARHMRQEAGLVRRPLWDVGSGEWSSACYHLSGVGTLQCLQCLRMRRPHCLHFIGKGQSM